MDGLTTGRIVHYVMPNQVHRPAVVVNVGDEEKGVVNLMVFTDPGLDGEGIRYSTDVEHSEDPAVNTWHWIEKA